jgi:hypothetical protein
MATDFEHDEMRALNACDDIRKATGLDLSIHWSGRKSQWLAGLNNPGAIPNEFGSVDDAIDWAYWYAGAQ